MQKIITRSLSRLPEHISYFANKASTTVECDDGGSFEYILRNIMHSRTRKSQNVLLETGVNMLNSNQIQIAWTAPNWSILYQTGSKMDRDFSGRNGSFQMCRLCKLFYNVSLRNRMQKFSWIGGIEAYLNKMRVSASSPQAWVTLPDRYSGFIFS